jgi:hypothetical protein
MKKNSNNKIIGTLTLVFIMLTFNNCNEDDLLNKYPKDAINAANYFVDASSAKGAVVAIFSNWNQRYTMFPTGLQYLDLMTDDTFTRNLGVRGKVNNYAIEEYDTTSDQFKDWWIYIYRSINDANFCIDYIPTSSDPRFTIEQQKPYIAIARFMRAFGYIYLTSLYGDVPLHTSFISKVEDSYKPRTPATEVYDLIIEDLIYAKQNLPEQWPVNEYGFPTKAAGAGMLAKAFLYNKDFPNAEIASKDAIQIANATGYELMSDYEYMMSQASQPNKEFIFAITFKENETTYGNVNRGLVERLPRGGDTPSGPTLPPQLYAVMGGDGWGYILPSRDLYNEFEPGDPRRKFSMWVPGDFYGIYHGNPFKYINPYTKEEFIYNEGDTIYYQKGWSPTFMNTRKLISSVSGLVSTTASGYDLPILRYADLLLIYAESLIENGKINEGIEQINKVRARPSVNMPPVSASDKMEATAKLRHERRIELNLEMQRIFDLRRWGIVEQELGAGLNSTKVLVRYGDDSMYKGTQCEFPKHLLMPIPLGELDINEFVQQNPGY